MDLQPGARLGPYEIVSCIGRGGMGEVWRARDSRLNRDVAIKVSARQFSDRFEREARAIAALNHPNICTLFDVGPNYLVMELIEGPTLAAQIARGPMSTDEALRIARQIAEALEAAHEKGIVHRDLKPTNIKLGNDGTVKVLDFGLASAGDAVELTHDSPTIMSIPGMILGTASYMSPEQASGRKTDKRTDIWAFGVVLYEMVTGARLFGGDTVSETIAAVIKDNPDLTKAPPRLQALLQRCLEKDPRKRLRDISSIEFLLGGEAAASAPRKTRWFGLAGWIVAGAALIGTAFLAFRPVEKASVQPVVRFTIPPPEKLGYGSPTVSPDGERIAFSASNAVGKTGVWIRNLNSLTPRELPGTEGGSAPFWSPDARHLGFISGRTVRKIGVDDGIVETIGVLPGGAQGGLWLPDGNIVMGVTLSGLYVAPASGGTFRELTRPDAARKETRHYWPALLPDGKHFLFLITSSLAEAQGVWVATVDNPAERRRVLADSTQAAWSEGHLLFVRRGVLMAQKLDLKSFQVTGEPVPISDHVYYGAVAGFADFSVSPNGVLAIGVEQQKTQMATFDRTGKMLSVFGPTMRYQFLSISPDQQRVASDAADASGYQLFVLDPARNATAQITTGAATGNFPVWSPDGSKIAFGSNRSGNYDIFLKPSSGTSQEEILLGDKQNKFVMDWSRDGRYLLYGARIGNKEDLRVLTMTGEHRSLPVVEDEFDKRDARFSSDGRWIAYDTSEAGTPEVFVHSFRPDNMGGGGASKIQISTGGATRPHWRDDGRELFYIDLSGRLMSADIRITGGRMEAGVPRTLFEAGLVENLQTFDVYRDGQRFVMAGRLGVDQAPVTVILNWTGLLNRK